MCKANFAACVNEKTPHDHLTSRVDGHNYALSKYNRLRVSLDTPPEMRHKYIYVLW